MSTEETRNWTLRVREKSHGPFTQNEVQKLITNKKVSSMDFISHPIVTNGSWMKLGNLRFFEPCEDRANGLGSPPLTATHKPEKPEPLKESGTQYSTQTGPTFTVSRNGVIKKYARKNRSNALAWRIVLAIAVLGAGSIATAILYNSVLTKERVIFENQRTELEGKLKKFDESVMLLQKQIAEEHRKRGDDQQLLSGMDKKDVQINGLQLKVEQLISDNASMKKQLEELKNQNSPITVGSMIDDVEKNANIVAETIGLTDAKPTILKAASLPNIAWGAPDPYLYVEVGVVVKNTTSKALSELTFHVQLKSRNRTVPIGESIETLKIPGGIEPREQKLLQVNVRGTKLGISGSEYQLRQMPAGAEVFVAIVDLADFENGKELYEIFADAPHVVAPYTFVERRDPALKALGLQ